jgi:hypothetical protein
MARPLCPRTSGAAGRLAVVPASLMSWRSCWQAAVRGRGCTCLLYCARLTTRRLPCPCPSHRIRPTSGRRRRGRALSTAGPKPCHAHVAATAPVHTLTPVPARPAAAGGGVVSAAATPGSMRPTPLDSAAAADLQDRTLPSRRAGPGCLDGRPTAYEPKVAPDQGTPSASYARGHAVPHYVVADHERGIEPRATGRRMLARPAAHGTHR